jgi:hypothetical protein
MNKQAEMLQALFSLSVGMFELVMSIYHDHKNEMSEDEIIVIESMLALAED